MSATVRNNTELGRYELFDGQSLIGFADYVYRDQKLVITHTEVEPSLQGKGYGSKLAHRILETLRAEGKRVVPACSFIAAYIDRHPEFADLRD